LFLDMSSEERIIYYFPTSLLPPTPPPLPPFFPPLPLSLTSRQQLLLLPCRFVEPGESDRPVQTGVGKAGTWMESKTLLFGFVTAQQQKLQQHLTELYLASG
jgi:hypothetical protein